MFHAYQTPVMQVYGSTRTDKITIKEAGHSWAVVWENSNGEWLMGFILNHIEDVSEVIKVFLPVHPIGLGISKSCQNRCHCLDQEAADQPSLPELLAVDPGQGAGGWRDVFLRGQRIGSVNEGEGLFLIYSQASPRDAATNRPLDRAVSIHFDGLLGEE